MKLTIKEIAPYFHTDNFMFVDKNGKKGYFTNDCFDDGWDLLFDVKPLLHPLSALTTEIEHNGERFVPQERLNVIMNDIMQHKKIEIFEHTFKIYEDMDWVAPEDRYFAINPNKHLPMSIVEKLYEWHFAINIPENLYIKKNATQ